MNSQRFRNVALTASSMLLTAAAFAQAPAAPAVPAAAAPAPIAVDKNLGRNLAATCANCHGTGGKSVAEVPSIAGVPAAVTIQKMKDYRDGKLPATIMHQLSKGFTDQQITLVAEYLAKQPK